MNKKIEKPETHILLPFYRGRGIEGGVSNGGAQNNASTGTESDERGEWVAPVRQARLARESVDTLPRYEEVDEERQVES